MLFLFEIIIYIFIILLHFINLSDKSYKKNIINKYIYVGFFFKNDYFNKILVYNSKEKVEKYI